MRELEYPFDSEYLYHKKKSIRKQLLAQLDEKSCLHFFASSMNEYWASASVA